MSLLSWRRIFEPFTILGDFKKYFHPHFSATVTDVPSKLLSVRKFKAGEFADPLIIECNADFVQLPMQFTKVHGLKMSRRLNNSEEFDVVAEYFPYYPLLTRKEYHVRLFI